MWPRLLALSLAALLAAPRVQAVQVGSLNLAPCAGGAALCGDLERPLDDEGAARDRIPVHFEFYRHGAAGPAQGTLVAVDGGPGYPTTLSRDDYLALFGPLMASRDVLLMDNRGTGRSGAIDCPKLQTAVRWTVALNASCGVSLGERAALYSTAAAADDLAAVLAALRLGRIDLYGNSYGTYFEQVFAVRHAGTLRSLILDGAYPVDGPDYAWYPSYAPAMRAKFNLACERSKACAQLPGNSIDHIRPLLQELRAHPFPAKGQDADGMTREFIANPAMLATVMFGSAPALATVRETDAAARAFVEGDRLPMLRLMAESSAGVDSRDPAKDAKVWSAGLAIAVMCQDAPQIFDMRLPPVLRLAARERALEQRRRDFPDTYAPFTIDEYRGLPLDYGFIDQCVEWPVAPAAHPASAVIPADASYPDVPALIISGELDNMTTVADGAAVAAHFKRGRQLLIANSFHVNALPRSRSPCAAELVRRFIEQLDPGEVGCTAAIAPLRLVGEFASSAAALAPAEAVAGNQASPDELRLVTAAVETVADVLIRARLNASGRGPGLRAGSFEVKHTAGRTQVELHRVRWTADVAVSGRIDASQPPAATVAADVEVTKDAQRGTFKLRWQDRGASPLAQVDGQYGRHEVHARLPAP